MKHVVVVSKYNIGRPVADLGEGGGVWGFKLPLR